MDRYEMSLNLCMSERLQWILKLALRLGHFIHIGVCLDLSRECNGVSFTSMNYSRIDPMCVVRRGKAPARSRRFDNTTIVQTFCFGSLHCIISGHILFYCNFHERKIPHGDWQLAVPKSIQKDCGTIRSEFRFIFAEFVRDE
jgi:hypothetical protein